MRTDAPVPGVAALRARLAAAPDLTSAFSAFEALLPDYGYATLDYASGPIVRWPMQSNLDWRPDVIHASYDWQDEFFGQNFQEHDRFVPHMLQQVSPFPYWDVWEKPSADPVVHTLEAIVQTRIGSGLSVPLHGPGLRFSGVNLGSKLSRDDHAALDAKNRAEVVLLALTLHQHVQDSRAPAPAPKRPVLTPRERECLGWAAAGKTMWETGQILAISESAVKKHLTSAATRLGVRTRAHAVAVAVSQGLL